MESQDRERIDSLERAVTSLAQAKDALTDELNKARFRVLALEAILEAKGVISSEETAAKVQAIGDAVTLRIEFAQNFRHRRRLAQVAGEQPDERSSNTTPPRQRDLTG
jgi:hypothetical protein